MQVAQRRYIKGVPIFHNLHVGGRKPCPLLQHTAAGWRMLMTGQYFPLLFVIFVLKMPHICWFI